MDYIQMNGELFRDVQLSGMFKDGKTFTDSVPLRPPEEIKERYNKEKQSKGFDLKLFVEKNFFFEPEIKPDSKYLKNLKMEEHLDVMWDILSVNLEEQEEKKYSTLIKLPKPFIVPGGRFREMYYWDSYFNLVGLAATGRTNHINDKLTNLKYMAEKFGFIPNGNRRYYLGRSQPPLFPMAVKTAARYVNLDETEYIEGFENEYGFYMEKKRLHELEDGMALNHYSDEHNLPREEGYLVDTNKFEDIEEKYKSDFYRNRRAVCESGWDFSGRWLEDGKTAGKNICTDIIPVCLNSILYANERYFASLYKITGENEKAFAMEDAARKRKDAINYYLWDEDEGFYFDYNTEIGKKTGYYSLAGVYPLFAGLADENQANKIAGKIESLFLKDGGLQTSLYITNEQWDSPDGWAPLHWLTVTGLHKYGFIKLAERIKQAWMSNVRYNFDHHGIMFEKYNTVNPGTVVMAGEYSNQAGFGWTNGVTQAFLNNLEKDLKDITEG